MSNQENHINQLKQLWQTAFGDSPDYIDFYFNRAYQADKTTTRAIGGQIVSAAQYRHFDIISDGKTLKGVYILGVCTYSAFRRKGLASSIVHQILDEQAALGVDVAFLIPSDADLFAYYKQLGFESVFTAYEEIITKNSLDTDIADVYGLIKPTTRELSDFYTKFYRTLNRAAFKDYDFFKTIIDGVADFGGNIEICGENGEIKGFVAIEGGMIKELLCIDVKARNTLLSRALMLLDADEIKAVYPIGSPVGVIGGDARSVNIGMAKMLSDACDLSALKGAYANLLLN